MTARLERAPAHKALRRSGVIPVARWLLGRQLEIVQWFLGLVVLVFGVAYPAIGRSGGELPLSIWESFAANGPGWFALAMGATAVTTYLPMIIANGMTRARFTASAALALAGCATLLAVVIAAGFNYESYMYRLYGWHHALNGSHVFASSSQVLLIVAEYAVRYLLFGLVGLLAGYGYYRVGGWWGTALLPVTVVLPLGVGAYLLDFQLVWTTEQTGLLTRTGTALGFGAGNAAGLVLALVFCALLVFVTRAIMSTVPIRSKAA